MAKNTKKNQMECNKQARKKYLKENYKYQSVAFKKEELEEINAYCKKFGIAKNTLFREVILKHIGKSVD